MRHGGPGRRFRNNNRNNTRRGNGRNQSFESTGPDVKVRGTAQQVADKYVAFARDASAAGDHVAAENCLQHAEHYQRIVNYQAERALEQQREREARDDNRNGKGRGPGQFESHPGDASAETESRRPAHNGDEGESHAVHEVEAVAVRSGRRANGADRDHPIPTGETLIPADEPEQTPPA